MPNYSGMWTMEQQFQAIGSGKWPSPPALPGQQAYTTPGTYSWTAPAGVTSVCVVCVGGGGFGYLRNDGGGGGGGGGGLGWKNNIPVEPGTSYTVVVGAGGGINGTASAAGDSYFISLATVAGLKGANTTPFNTANAGGSYAGDGGGAGGNGGQGFSSDGSQSGGGAGAGGYTGSGGNGQGNGQGRTNGAGGGGAGGNGGGGDGGFGAGGGGVGILGAGASGSSSGAGGSSGSNSTNQNGALYGGSGGGAYQGFGGGNSAGGGGAVRIIWGDGRAFPSTNTGNV
jgi:hypothetical protein